MDGTASQLVALAFRAGVERRPDDLRIACQGADRVDMLARQMAARIDHLEAALLGAGIDPDGEGC